MKRLPTKRALHLHNLTADTLPFTLHFDNLPGACRRAAARCLCCVCCVCCVL
jgi:hypothetical protein